MTQTKPKIAPAIRHCEFIPGGIHLFEMPASRRDTKHVQEIDIEQMIGRCSCEHFRFKLAPQEPTLGTPSLLCKHLHAGVEWLLDNDYLDAEDLRVAELLHDLSPCCECGNAGADLPMCDENARPLDGMLCRECFISARTLNFDWTDEAHNLDMSILLLEEKRDALIADDATFGTNSHARELREIHEQLMSLWQDYMTCEPIQVRQ